MKKIILTLSIISGLGLGSCSKEDKAKSAVKDLLSKTMHDFKSYEPVQFGKLDSAYTIYERSPEYIKKFQIVQSLMKEHDTLKEDYDRLSIYLESYDPRIEKNVNIRRVILDSASNIVKDLNKKGENFKKTFAGYALPHTYRGKNSHGALIITTDTFYLDKDLKAAEVFK